MVPSSDVVSYSVIVTFRNFFRSVLNFLLTEFKFCYFRAYQYSTFRHGMPYTRLNQQKPKSVFVTANIVFSNDTIP
ncbi:hypothetical protein VNO80_04581 [Phaseolus coccineus]|uniref:Uncharacterized protein n=1 Tax=Phaseolus coccineus TaxID=3886 RepID=A0AAN9RRX3_PHACN